MSHHPNASNAVGHAPAASSAGSTAAGPAGATTDQNFDYMFKLLIIGNSSVGKTSFLCRQDICVKTTCPITDFLVRYCDDSFTSAFVSTVGIDFKVKTVFRGDKRVKLQIWDTAGWVEESRMLGFNNYNQHLQPGTLPHHHYCLLPWCDGLHSHVRHHKRGVIQLCPRLVHPNQDVLLGERSSSPRRE
jgi:hypothetical protein